MCEQVIVEFNDDDASNFDLGDKLVHLMRTITVTKDRPALRGLFDTWAGLESEIDFADWMSPLLMPLIENLLAVVLNQLAQIYGGVLKHWCQQHRLYQPPIVGSFNRYFLVRDV